MESRSQTWLIIRIASLVLSAPLWLIFRAEMPGDFSVPPSWYFPLFLVGFSLFSVIFISVIRSDKEWVAPSWYDNPFDRSRPLQAFHLASWSFLVGSLFLLVVGLFREQPDWAWVLPACMGIGMLAGVRYVSIPKRGHGT